MERSRNFYDQADQLNEKTQTVYGFIPMCHVEKNQ